MNPKSLFCCLLLLIFLQIPGLLMAQSGFKIDDRVKQKKVDILYNQKLIGSYYYSDSLNRPVLFPVSTFSGAPLTRGFPLAPRVNERTDHPEEFGWWVGAATVNGINFQNVYDKGVHGIISHDRIIRKEVVNNQAILEVSAQWKIAGKIPFLEEITRYIFSVRNGDLVIDRSTQLVALQNDVKFESKESLLSMRVSRELELLTDKPIVFVGKNLKPSTKAEINNVGVCGVYENSEHIMGAAINNKSARWIELSGTKNDTVFSIAFIDHPFNQNYPNKWQVNPAGEVSVNPIGSKVFKAGEQISFKIRLLIREGRELLPADIDIAAKDFEKVTE